MTKRTQKKSRFEHEDDETIDMRKIQKEKRPPNNWKKLLERIEDDDD